MPWEQYFQTFSSEQQLVSCMTPSLHSGACVTAVAASTMGPQRRVLQRALFQVLHPQSQLNRSYETPESGTLVTSHIRK